MKVETKNSAGDLVTGAECKLSNDYGAVSTKSGETLRVRRSSADLDIVCKHPGQADANGRAVSRVNGGMFGNILLGGGIGAVIDHSKGTAYTYPTWVQLVFGKSLVFDRQNEQDGQPTVAMEASGVGTSTSAPSATPTTMPVSNTTTK